MLGLLAIGTLWFWVVLVLLFCVVTTLVEVEAGAWATGVLLVSVFGMTKLYHVSLWTIITTNPGVVATGVCTYFLCGIVWSFIKWYFFLRKRVTKYNELKTEFLENKGVNHFTSELASMFNDKLAYHQEAKPVKASDHKSDLTRWATYWPFSMTGTLLNDFVRKAWEHIYNMLHTTYQRMADTMFADAKKDAALAAIYDKEQS